MERFILILLFQGYFFSLRVSFFCREYERNAVRFLLILFFIFRSLTRIQSTFILSRSFSSVTRLLILPEAHQGAGEFAYHVFVSKSHERLLLRKKGWDMILEVTGATLPSLLFGAYSVQSYITLLAWASLRSVWPSCLYSQGSSLQYSSLPVPLLHEF